MKKKEKFKKKKPKKKEKRSPYTQRSAVFTLSCMGLTITQFEVLGLEGGSKEGAKKTWKKKEGRKSYQQTLLEK